jgi:peptidoglycan hydrolase-like protein with peptidoglycan-binding domain
MPCSNNGRIAESELVAIRPYGRLQEDAGNSWNAGLAPAGLEPTGPELSTYRDIQGQESTWATFQAGGPLAAVVGTSEHGCGKAVDLKAPWMRSWIDDHGARWGWRKIEAFSEWWHVNYVGGKFAAPFKVLRYGSHETKRIRWYTKRLAFIRPDHQPSYLKSKRGVFDLEVRAAVREFQRDHDLDDDGIIGEDTAHRISAVFHKQYEARNKRRRLVRDHKGLRVVKGGRKRLARDAARLRP